MPRACSEDGLLTPAPGGVRIAVRLTPRGRADRIEGIVRAAEDRPALKVSVTAPPTEGRANDTLIQLLAKQWRVPKRDVAIVAGLKSRDKIVHIAGEPALLLNHLKPLLASLPVS